MGSTSARRLPRLSIGVLVAMCAGATLAAQIPSRNVNMVSGTEWPGGDPFLQRQNEPTIAASTRNPLHLVGGSNDYRTVDLPGLPGGTETGDAWLSVYKSFDGGQRWSSTLIPGYPQDTSAAGMASPIKGYQAAADPVVRAGTNGLIYYNGLAFDRDAAGRSAIFLARFIDRNNKENGDPISYLGTSVVAATSGAAFFDKPWIAIDIPRGGNPPLCVVAGVANGASVQRNGHRNLGAGNGKGNQVPDDGVDRVPGGAIYVAYTSITGADATLRSEIFLKRSVDCGATWSAPIRVSRTTDAVNQGASIAINPVNGNVEVAWRRFANASAPDADAIMVARLPAGAGVFDPPAVARGLHRTGTALQDLDELFEHRKRGVHTAEAADIAEMDQNTTDDRFRTNAYPTMTIDGSGRVYLAWAERGFGIARPDVVDGDSRILVATSSDGITFAAPRVVDDGGGQGHQLMPTLAFAGGRLMLVFYDLRETKANVFGRYASDELMGVDAQGRRVRQTIDIRASLGTPGATPSFLPSVRVSDYLVGGATPTAGVKQLQVNPPNLPMFKLGTVPFLGDYIDVAPVAGVRADRGRRLDVQHRGHGHGAGLPHRLDRQPRRASARATATGRTTRRRRSSGGRPPACSIPRSRFPHAGRATPDRATRTSTPRKIGGGLLVGAPGNTKPLSTTLPRGFVVFAQNRTTLTKTFRMRVLAQPAGGRASFAQFPLPPYTSSSPAPLTSLDVQVPPLSTASRTLYVTAPDPKAQVNVDVSEVSAVGGTVVAGGLTGSVLLNPDIANPDIANPDIANPDIANPDIANAEVYNPDIANPDIANPDIANPDIANPDIANPDIANVVVANPDIANPDIANPDIANPDIANPDIANPDIANPDIANGAISDVSWTVSNTGNTTSAFNVNLFLANTTLPAGLKTQLILYKTYQTPVLAVNGCDLRVETRNQLLSNIVRPTFVTPGQAVPDQNSPLASNATLWLAPGEVARITLRVFDNDRSNNIIVTNLDGTTASIDPALNPATTLTAGIAAQGVDVGPGALDPPGATKPPIVTTTGTNLFYLQQPTFAAPGAVMTPAVRVRVWSNAGLPLPGVSVSMALVSPPAGVVLGGTTTAVSDADGIATFSTLSVNTAAIGLSLRATATSVGVVASGTSAPFSVGAVGPWTASGSGVVTDRGRRRDGSPGHAVSEQRPGHFQRQLAVEQRRDPDENDPAVVRMGRFPLLFHGQCPSRRIRQPKRG